MCPHFTLHISCFIGGQMRYIKRFLPLLLVIAFCIPLCGCGAFQTQMAKTTTKMANLDSFHADVDIELDTLTTIGGQELHLASTVTGGFDFESDPLLVQTDLLLDAFGQQNRVQCFIQKEYDTVRIIPWSDDRLFRELSLTMNAAKRIKVLQALKLLIKCADTFSDPVEDTLDGIIVKRYDGLFPQEYVDEALILLDLKEAEPESDAEVTASPVPPSPIPASPAAASSEVTASVSEVSEENPSNPASSEEDSSDLELSEEGSPAPEEGPVGIPGSIWVGKDDMIVQVQIDVADFAQTVTDDFLDQFLDEYDLDGLELSVLLKSMSAKIHFSQFNEVEKLVLPE